MKRILTIGILLCFLQILCYGFSFHLVCLNVSEQPIPTLYRLNTLFQQQLFADRTFVFSTGGLFSPQPLHLYSHLQSEGRSSPLGRILHLSGAVFYAPSQTDWNHGLEQIRKGLSIDLPIVATDAGVGSALSHWVHSAAGKNLLLINILSQHTFDWYDILRIEVDLSRIDLILLIMDEPSLRMVPENLRSKTVAISRKTAMYHIDLEYGLLVTEVPFNQPQTTIAEIEHIEQQINHWRREELPLDPAQLTFVKQTSFFRHLSWMLNQIKSVDGILIHHEPLPKQITPDDAISFFGNYVIGSVQIPGKEVRILLEQSASMFDYDGVEIHFTDRRNYYSFFGEPYYIDLTRPKGNRLIMKTFTQPLEIIVFGERSRLIADFPGIQIQSVSVLTYTFWAMHSYNPFIDPSWKVTILPYYRNYIIQSGDTLNSISNTFGITKEAILRLNPDLIERYLLPGTVITVHIPYKTEAEKESEDF